MRVVSLLASGTEIVVRPGSPAVARRPVARMRQPAVSHGAAGLHETRLRHRMSSGRSTPKSGDG